MDPYHPYAAGYGYGSNEAAYGAYSYDANYQPVPAPDSHGDGFPAHPPAHNDNSQAVAAAMHANMWKAQVDNAFSAPSASTGVRRAPVPHPQLPNQRQPPNNKTGIGYGQWVAPGGQYVSPAGLGVPNFPKKQHAASQPPNQQKRSAPAPYGWPGKSSKRQKDVVDKTPAQMLHELFTNIEESYENCVAGKATCVLKVEGQDFCMEAPTRKLAKQRTAEIALRTLRPGIAITPFAGAVEVQPLAVLQNAPRVADTYAASLAHPPTPPAIPAPSDATSSSNINNIGKKSSSGGPPQKKFKLYALESAASVADCLWKLCEERSADGPYNPKFEDIDITDEAGRKQNIRRCRYMLSFPEIGKVFTHEGDSRQQSKDMVCRKALRDVFNVTEPQIRAIIRRNIMGKIADRPIVPTLFTVAELSNCELSFQFSVDDDRERAAGVGMGMGVPLFTCVCTMIDHGVDERVTKSTSPPSSSKQEAKEHVARELLKSYFGIEMEPRGSAPPQPKPTVVRTPAEMLANIAVIHINKPAGQAIKYEDMGAAPAGGFNHKCTIEGKDFIGFGTSKKLAKQHAATLALKEVFKIDYNNPDVSTLAQFERPAPVPRPAPIAKKVALRRNSGTEPVTRSNLLASVYEYTRKEYDQMADYYGIQKSTNIAAFYLLNEKDEKRMVSIGSSQTFVVSGSMIKNCQGTTLLHMDAIVLARRAFVRYLMLHLSKMDEPNAIFYRTPNGLCKLNDNLRVVLYANYSPGVQFSSPRSPFKSLSITGPHGCIPVTEHVQTMAEIEATDSLKVHSVADKIFKWANIGVQGALLSNLIMPIPLQTVLFGSEALATDKELSYSFFSRLEPARLPVLVESRNACIDRVVAPSHVWTRDVDKVEQLNIETGRMASGAPSMLSKAAMLEAYTKLTPQTPSDTSYMEIKAGAIAYNEAKRVLYERVAAAGQGRWQRKPAELIDFSLGTFSE